MNNLLVVLLGALFLVLLYNLLDSRQNQQQMQQYHQLGGTPGFGDDSKVQTEVVYTQDYYPWWRSTRSWNYDSWLYQKPYYNYWRRPQYYNYWHAGRPLIIGGKRYYRRRFW